MTHGIFGCVETKKTKNTTPKISLIIAALAIPLLITPAASAANPPSLQITNFTGETITLPYDKLQTLPKTTVYAELLCYGEPMAIGNWGGVALSELLAQAGLDPAVESIDFAAQDGYEVSIPVELAQNPNVIVAYEKDNATLGETLRLVLPGYNGNVWIAMLTSINMSTEPSLSPLSSQVNTPLDQAKALFQNQPTIQPNPMPTSTPAPKIQTPTPQPTVTPTNPPVSPSVNATQPPTQQDAPKDATTSSREIVYAAALGATIAVIAAGFAVYRRRTQRA